MHYCKEQPKPKDRHIQAHSTQGFSVDAALLPVLEKLWSSGIETLCSCEGDELHKHGILDKPHEHFGFISFEDFEGSVVFMRMLQEYGVISSSLHAGVYDHFPDREEFVVEFSHREAVNVGLLNV